MQLKQIVPISKLCVILLAFFSLTSAALAQDGRSAAELIALNGQAEVKSSGGNFRPGQIRDRLNVGDTIRTLEKSKAKLLFQDDSVTVLGEKTTLEISQYSYNAKTQQRQSLLKAIEGKIRFTVQKISGAPDPDMTIETEVLSVGVRGTDGILETGPQNRVYLLEAASPLLVKNKFTGQSINLPPMQYALADKFKPFQINTITPAMYQRLIGEFRLSYAFEPKNLVTPEQPTQSSFLLAGPGELPAVALPPVNQQPLPASHLPPVVQNPLPPVHLPFR
jgi:hypothetical protein